jgi:hypothetical protein
MNQLPKPPINAGIIVKKDHRQAVGRDDHIVRLMVGAKEVTARPHQSGNNGIRSRFHEPDSNEGNKSALARERYPIGI